MSPAGFGFLVLGFLTGFAVVTMRMFGGGGALEGDPLNPASQTAAQGELPASSRGPANRPAVAGVDTTGVKK